MGFVVKNISGGAVSLDDIGLTLAIGEEVDLVEEQGNEVGTSSDIVDAINAGDIVFLDPLDDLTELSQAESLEIFDTVNHPNYRIFGGELDQLDDVILTNPLVDQVLVSFVGSPAGSPQTIKWQNQVVGAANDQLVRVSATDTTSGFLASKLVIGSPATISLTVKNPAGNETLAIDLDAELDDLNDVNVSSAVSGQVLTFQGSPPVWTAEDAIIGLSVQGIWRFRTETAAADPGAGRFRYDSATPASVTAIYIDQFTDNGVDAQTILESLKAGQQIYIQQSSDSAAFLLVTITSITDNTGWFTIGVTVDSSGTLPTNNAQCGFLMLFTVETAQNLFETVEGDSGSITASSPNDTLVIAGGASISTAITFEGSPQVATLTITNGAPNVDQNLFETFVTDSGSVTAGSITAQLIIAGGEGINTAIAGSPQTLTIVNDAPKFTTINSDSGSATAGSTTAQLLIAGGNNVNTAIAGSPQTLTIDGVNIWNTIIGDSGSLTPSVSLDTLDIAGGTGIDTSIALAGSPQVATLTVENVAPKFVTVSGDSGVATADNVADDLKIIGGFKITTTASEAIGSPEQDGILIDWGANISDLDDVQAGLFGGSPAPVNNNTLQFTTSGSPPINKWINIAGTAAPPAGSFGTIQLFWGPIDGISGTTKIPKDDTTPLITEGTEIWSQFFTPVGGSPTTTIQARTNFTFSSSNSALELVIAVFRDDVCIGVSVSSTSNNNSGFTVAASFYDEEHGGDGASHTYSCRVGRTGNNGTWYVNEISGTADAFPKAGSPNGGVSLVEQNAFLIMEIGTNS